MILWEVTIEGQMTYTEAFHFGMAIEGTIWHYILEPFLNWMRLKPFYNARHTRTSTSSKNTTKTTALIP
jgi:hypothetical protein